MGIGAALDYASDAYAFRNPRPATKWYTREAAQRQSSTPIHHESSSVPPLFFISFSDARVLKRLIHPLTAVKERRSSRILFLSAHNSGLFAFPLASSLQDLFEKTKQRVYPALYNSKMQRHLTYNRVDKTVVVYTETHNKHADKTSAALNDHIFSLTLL